METGGYLNYSTYNMLAFNITRIHESECKIDFPKTEVTAESFAIMIILGVFSVIGTIGNGLVIYVYTQKKDKLTSSVFILALAGTDIITCTIIIPYTIAVIHEDYQLQYDAVCKIYNFLITSNVPLSAFIMVAIAVDRYICICHPFVHIMTVPRAKTIVTLLGAFACVLGLLTALNYDVYQLPADLEIDFEVNISLYNVNECEIIYTGVCSSSSKIIERGFRDMYQKIYSSFYLISLLLVIILYAIIYRSVISRRAKRQKQKRQKPQFSTTMVQTDETTCVVLKSSSGGSTVNLKVDTKENGVNTKPETQKLNNGETVPLRSSNSKHGVKEKKDHIHLANIKTAIMLCVVTVVFIIAFLPAWLMALGWVTFQPFGFYIYFVYNVANPVIYAFMNQVFRNDLIKLFNSCRVRQ